MLLQNNEGPRQDRGSASCPHLSDRQGDQTASRSKNRSVFWANRTGNMESAHAPFAPCILHAVIATSNGIHRR